MKTKEQKKEATVPLRRDGELVSPANGKVLPLSLVEDEVFAEGILGGGVALIPETGEIYAPADGVIDAVFDTGHALSMTVDFGAEILIHCGLDTVKLRGEGFECLVQKGERVVKGQLLLRFSPGELREKGYYVTTPVVIVNSDHFRIRVTDARVVRHGERLMMLYAEERKDKEGLDR